MTDEKKIRYFVFKDPKNGSHVEDDKVYRPGDRVPSTKDLASSFPFKFEEASSKEATGPLTHLNSKEEEKAEEPVPEVVEEVEPVVNRLGVDITSRYKEASDAHVLVLKVGKAAKTRYIVVGEDSPDVPLTDKSMKKTELETFLATLG